MAYPFEPKNPEKRYEFVPVQNPEPIPQLDPDIEHARGVIRGLIASLIQAMETNPSYNNAVNPSQLAAALLANGMIADLGEFEQYLRDMGTRVYLIGADLGHSDKTRQVYGCIYPHRMDAEPEYELYVAVNGPREAEERLAEIGISAEENAERLKTTGFLALL